MDTMKATMKTKCCGELFIEILRIGFNILVKFTWNFFYQAASNCKLCNLRNGLFS
jgi:hypothetical protein